MPRIFDDAVSQIEKSGKARKDAIAIATWSLQKASDLKPGTRTATSKGIKLGLMTRAQRKVLRDQNK